MTAIYSFQSAKLEHHLMCNGASAVFGIDGKYKGNNAVMGSMAREVDVISLLQQGELCEVAILVGGQYVKRDIGLSAFTDWYKTLPVRPMGTFTIKRLVGEEKCMQTIYVYNQASGMSRYLRGLIG